MEGLQPTSEAAAEVVAPGTEVIEGEVQETTPSGEVGESAEEQTFYNPADVPTELRPTFLELKKAYTQKTQGLAARQKELSEAEYKSGLFDDLMRNPQVVSYLRQLRDGEVSEEGEGSEDLDVDPGVTQAVTRAIDPLRKELVQLQRDTAIDRERSQFTKSHPNWEQYWDSMKKAWKEDQNRSMVDAFNWAREEERSASEKREKQQQKVVQAGVERPGTSAAATKKMPEKPSWDEAVNAAFEEHNLDRRKW